MILPWEPTFCTAVCILAVWLALLWMCSRLTMTRRRKATKVLVGAAAILMLFVPISGLPLWNRVFSFYPNPSLPMLGLLCAALWQRLLGVSVFKPADWRALWVFGVVGGTALYLHPMMFGAVDLYYWGWDRDLASWCLAALAIVPLLWGNRIGALFLAALIAYGLNALESQNGWDYVMDPFYWLLSVGIAGAQGIGWCLRRFVGARAVEKQVRQPVLIDALGREEVRPVRSAC